MAVKAASAHGGFSARQPLSDAEFTRTLHAEGSLSGEDAARATGANRPKPLSDAEFESRMRAEDKGKGQNTGQRYRRGAGEKGKP